MAKLIYSILLLAAFSACDRQSNSSYQEFLSQARKDRYTGYRVYVDDTGLMDSTHFLDGLRDGDSYEKRNGVLESKAHYKLNKLDGIFTEYFPNGNVSAISYWRKDKIIGDNLLFYKSGRIWKYRCYDYFERNCRLKIYDSIGRLVRNDGDLFIGRYWNAHDDVFSSDSAVQVHQIIARAPHERVRVWIEDPWGKQSYPVDSFLIIYKKRLPPGDYPLIIYGESTDTVINLTKRDTIRIELTVR